MNLRTIAATAVVAAVGFGSAPAIVNAQPPNRNDPCGQAGRNTCGTSGVGKYERYRYGLRWFGDYRGAVKELGRAATFCLDLRYWYPGRQYEYREIGTQGLRNRRGAPVSKATLAQMSYAIWNHGRSNNANQQAAAMLYVHSLMRDGAPGEVSRDAIGPRVAAIYNRIERDSRRLRGPYRVQVSLPPRLVVSEKASGRVRVVSATGRGVPGVTVNLRGEGPGSVPNRVRTGRDGSATITITPSAAGELNLTATTQQLAAPEPRVFSPSRPAPARNAQRLASAKSASVQAQVTRPVQRGRMTITTRAVPATMPAGGTSRDRVTLSSAPTPGTHITVKMFGPFRSREAVTCTGTPAHESQITTTRSLTYMSDSHRVEAPGWYTYQLSMPETSSHAAVLTECGEPTETFRVFATPRMTSRVTDERIRPGQELSTAVNITGLAGETVPVTVELFGPFPTREAMKCDGPAMDTQTLTASGDGTYTTNPVKPTVPGYYVFREASAGTEFAQKAEIPCGDPLETAVVQGSPRVTTQVSAQETTPGSQIHDTLVVTGLGALKGTVDLELWGPYQSREEMTCVGKPAWSGTVEANGDGTYTSESVVVPGVGYFTYRERLRETPEYDGFVGECGVASETTIAKAAPKVTTTVSNQVVRPGSTIFDTLRVSGAGTTPLKIELALYGPFPTRAAMRCTGTPYWRGTVDADRGNGTYRSAPVRIDRAGFYTYQEHIAGTAFITATRGQCGVAAETSLGAPDINTGGVISPGDASTVRAAQLRRATPTRVRIPSLRINASVGPAGINLAKQELNVPMNILRTGWWRDGAAPGDRNGSVLIAGHVDSARRGAGAFFRLRQARPGMRIQVQTRAGTRTYRVTRVRTMPKARLPLDVYQTTGRARLNLVTCGGPFNSRTGHYRDNIVVTAVPV